MGPRGIIAWAIAILLTTVAWLHHRDWLLPFPRAHDIPPGRMVPDGGKAFTFAVPGLDPSSAQGRMFEGHAVRHPPLAALQSTLGWSRVHYYLDALIALRFPETAVRQEWSAIGPGESMHDAIRQQGGGRFSVWKETLHFSSSDGSDPRTNGKIYRLLVYPLVPSGLRSMLAGLAAGLGLVFVAMVSRGLYLRHDWVRVATPGLLVAFAMIVVLFAIAEVYLRARITFTETAWPSMEHPIAGFTFVPGGEVRHTNRADFWVRERANSIGFLDREPVTPKPRDTFRILVLGDSFVEAAQVPIARKFHVLLEERLRSANPGRDIDVVAMGYSGTGQANQLSFYEAFGRQLAPDLVLLVVVANDLPNNSPVLESVRNGWHPHHAPRLFFEVDHNAPGGFRRLEIDPKWKDHLVYPMGVDPKATYATRIARLRGEAAFAAKLEGWSFPDDPREPDFDRMFCATGPTPPVFDEAVAITGHVFRQFAELGRRDGFKTLAVAAENLTTFCAPANWARPTSRDAALRRMRAAAGYAGIEVVDLYPFFAAKANVAASRFRFDSHWSETGHRWVAEALAAHFASNPRLIAR